MPLARRHVHEPTPAPLQWYPTVVGNDAAAASSGNEAADMALFVPPTLPEAWAHADIAAAELVALHPRRGGAAFGGESCTCGGRWRYTLAGSDAHPVWRCLHCGGLFRDATRLA